MAPSTKLKVKAPKLKKVVKVVKAFDKEQKRKRKVEKEKDPLAPKMPVGGAYGVFASEKRQEFRKAVEAKGESGEEIMNKTVEAAKMMSKAWKDLSDEEITAYKQKYNQKFSAYKEDLSAYNEKKGMEAKKNQWTLIREELSAFSKQLVDLRSDVSGLRLAETQLHEQLATEVAHRQELGMRLDDAARGLRGELDSLGRGLRAEAAEQRDAAERAVRDLAAAEERASKALHELRRQHELHAEALEAERLERLAGDERSSGRLTELEFAIDEERNFRVSTCDSLEQEMSRLRVALEEEVRCRTHADRELTATLESQERKNHATQASLHQETSHMASLFEQEAKSRAAGDSQNERNLETALIPLRAAIEGANRRVHDQVLEAVSDQLRSFSEAHQSEARERAAAGEGFTRRLYELSDAVLQERNDRETADASLRTSLAGCAQDIAAERKERSLEATQTARAVQNAEERIKEIARELAGEISSRESGHAEAARQLAAATEQERADRDRQMGELEHRMTDKADAQQVGDLRNEVAKLDAAVRAHVARIDGAISQKSSLDDVSGMGKDLRVVRDLTQQHESAVKSVEAQMSELNDALQKKVCVSQMNSSVLAIEMQVTALQTSLENKLDRDRMQEIISLAARFNMKLNALEQHMQTGSSRVHVLEDDVRSLRTSITGISEGNACELRYIQQEIQAKASLDHMQELKGVVSEAQERILALEAMLHAGAAKMPLIENSMAALKAQLAKLDQVFHAKKGQIEQCEGAIATIEEDVSKLLDHAQQGASRLKLLEDKIANVGSDFMVFQRALHEGFTGGVDHASSLANSKLNTPTSTRPRAGQGHLNLHRPY